MVNVIGVPLPVGGVDKNGIVRPLQFDDQLNLKTGGSGAGIGGGSSVYSNTQGDFTATATGTITCERAVTTQAFFDDTNCRQMYEDFFI